MQRHTTQHAEGRINYVNLEEDVRQLFSVATGVIHRLPDIPEFRRRQKVTLHEATGGLFVERHGAFELFTVTAFQFLQNVALALILEVVEQHGRIVGIQAIERFLKHFIRQALNNEFAIFIAHLEKHFGREALRQNVGRSTDQAARQYLNNVRRISRVILLKNFKDFSLTPRFDRCL